MSTAGALIAVPLLIAGDPLRKLVGYNSGLNSAWHFAWTPDSKHIVSPVNLMPLPTPKGDPNQGPMPVGHPVRLRGSARRR